MPQDIVSDLPVVVPDAPPTDRRPALGALMVLGAATCFAVNGSVVKALLGSSGVSTARLTELRTAGAMLVFLVAVVLVDRRRLRVAREEIPLLLVYGIVCYVLVQWFYFVALERLPIGIAVLIQFTAPVFVALWAMLVWRQPVRGRIWAALGLAVAGIALVARVWDGFDLDGIGSAAAGGAAITLALYFVLGEQALGRRDPLSLITLALVLASAFWAVTQPWWSFPFDALAGSAPLGGNLDGISAPLWLLVAWMVVPGTVLPFWLSVGALRHLPATHVSLVAMTEPVIAGFVAWAWLGEGLGAVEIVGAAVTLLGIVLAQTARRGAA